MQDGARDDHRLVATYGSVLIGLDVVGVIWIAFQLMTVLNEPESVPLVAMFRDLPADARTLVVDEETVEFPEGLGLFLGVFLYVLVLWVAGSLIGRLIRSGVDLLQLDVARAVRRLVERSAAPARG